LASNLGVPAPFDVAGAMRPALEVTAVYDELPRPDAELRTVFPHAGQLGPLIFLPEELPASGPLDTVGGGFVIRTKARWDGKPLASRFTFEGPAPDADGRVTVYFGIKALWPHLRVRVEPPGCPAPLIVAAPHGAFVSSGHASWLTVRLAGALARGPGTWAVS